MQLDYARHLWLEKEIKSVANVTRADVGEFLRRAAAVPLRPAVQEYPLDAANQALIELKARRIRGAKVLRMAWTVASSRANRKIVQMMRNARGSTPSMLVRLAGVWRQLALSPANVGSQARAATHHA